MNTLTDLIFDTKGATAIEYAMISSVIAMATALGTGYFSTSIITAFSNLGGLFG